MKRKHTLIQLAVLAAVAGCGCLVAQSDAPHLSSDVGATWALTGEDGRIAEVALDFVITGVSAKSSSTVQIDLRASTELGEVGLSMELSKPHEVDVFTSKGLGKVIMSRFSVHPVGILSQTLERLLARELARPGEASCELLGIYDAIYDSPRMELQRPFVFATMSKGLALADGGAATPAPVERFYRLRCFVDGPRRRCTVYFSVPAGYGGVSPATAARQTWLGEVGVMRFEAEIEAGPERGHESRTSITDSDPEPAAHVAPVAPSRD